jgi:hypothetical protein
MDMIFLQVWFAHFVLQLILQVYSTVELNGRKNKHSLISMHLHGVGVWSREGPKPTSELVLRVPNLDGDARRVHGGLS